MRFTFIVVMFVILALTTHGRAEKEVTTVTELDGKAALVAAHMDSTDTVVLESGVAYRDMRVGSGPEPKEGDTVGFHYRGIILQTGKVIDDSRIKLVPTPLRLDWKPGKLIPGLYEGMLGMRVGGRRIVLIPPAQGYGEAGRPPEIPPKSWLVFDIELVEIVPPGIFDKATSETETF